MAGSLVLNLTEVKSYDYIQVQIRGGANVQWSESRTTGSGEDERSETVTYSANETYVEHTTVLWKKEQSPHGKIGPGSYKFPFQFTLPPQCPSSFTGSVGSIEYAIYGRVGTGLFRFDLRAHVPVQVSQIVDINWPHLLAPVRRSELKDVGCLCCISGNVELSVAVPRTGFCINGDRIPLTVMVENGSTQDISLKAAVTKFITYYAEGREKYDSATIVYTHSEQIPQNSTYTWNPANLLIPNVEITLDQSPRGIITIKYTLTIRAQIPYAIDPCIRIPIQLGNVPYQGTSETAVATPSIGFSFQPDPQARGRQPADQTDAIYQDAPPDYYQACGYDYSRLK